AGSIRGRGFIIRLRFSTAAFADTIPLAGWMVFNLEDLIGGLLVPFVDDPLGRLTLIRKAHGAAFVRIDKATIINLKPPISADITRDRAGFVVGFPRAFLLPLLAVHLLIAARLSALEIAQGFFFIARALAPRPRAFRLFR